MKSWDYNEFSEMGSEKQELRKEIKRLSNELEKNKTRLKSRKREIAREVEGTLRFEAEMETLIEKMKFEGVHKLSIAQAQKDLDNLRKAREDIQGNK